MKNAGTWNVARTVRQSSSAAARPAEESFSRSHSEALVSRNGHQRPEIGTEGERLEDCSHSTPEREPVQGVLESNRIARMSCLEKGRCCLCRGEHAEEREERGCIDRDSSGVPSAPATSSKDDRCYDTQDSTANPLKRVHDQTIWAQVGPPAELRPGRGTDALPGWHVHDGPVDAAGKHAIEESSEKDTAQ